MFVNAIDKKTKRVFEKIAGSKDLIFGSFYLAGGTALAIELGHRESIDLDWFAPEKFSEEKLKKSLSVLGKFKLTSEERGTIHGVLNGVRVSFLLYEYRRLFPLLDFEGVKIADERDIAAMKIDAVSSRGSKKDFIDLYFLLKKYPLPELVRFFEKKYKGIEYNRIHVLKSLSYFDDADKEPMPVMIEKVSWKAAKEAIVGELGKLI